MYLTREIDKVEKEHTTTADVNIWHKRLGHISVKAIMKAKEATKGMKVTFRGAEEILDHCEDCALTKAKKLPFAKDYESLIPKRKGELIVSDLMGPFNTQTLGGGKYTVNFTDVYSGFTHAEILKNKSGTFRAYKNFNEHFKTQFNLKIQNLRTDNGGEYMDENFQTYLKDEGTVHQLTNPYTPEQNKKAEKYNHLLYEKTLSLLKTSGLPKTLWGELYMTAVQ